MRMSEFFHVLDFTFSSRLDQEPLSQEAASRIRRRLHTTLRSYHFQVTELHGFFNWNTQGLECQLNEFTNNTLHIILKVDYAGFFSESSLFCLFGASGFVMTVRNEEPTVRTHCEVYGHSPGKVECLANLTV